MICLENKEDLSGKIYYAMYLYVLKQLSDSVKYVPGSGQTIQ